VFEIELRRVVVKKCQEKAPAELHQRICRALGVDE
jgi:hypothetical protein